MTNSNILATLLQFVILMAAVVATYAALLSGLRALLDELIKLPAASTFYLRSFALVLLFLALAEALSPIHLDAGSHFMEYVWAEADSLSDALRNFYVALLVYLGLITVLTAVLRRRHAE